jgi:hypothetical protein
MLRNLAAARLLPVAVLSACKSNSTETGVQGAAQSLASTASSLVNVDLSNVLNDLALDLNIERANIPVNAQIPITLAANICGVSINILSVSTGGQANCTAKTSSPELAQAVQQQLAAGGSVGGGAQTSTSGATSGTGTTSTTAPPPEGAEDAPQPETDEPQ